MYNLKFLKTLNSCFTKLIYKLYINLTFNNLYIQLLNKFYKFRWCPKETKLVNDEINRYISSKWMQLATIHNIR